MKIISLISLVFLTISCSHGRVDNSSIEDSSINAISGDMNKKTRQSLTLLIHSGHTIMIMDKNDTIIRSETQIIYCSPLTLKYGYGSVLEETDTLPNNLEWFDDYSKIDDYSIITRNLTRDEQTFIERSIQQLSDTYYVDPTIVKDGWKYILFVNNIKVASGYVDQIESYPKTIQDIILGLLELASPLYPCNGFV